MGFFKRVGRQVEQFKQQATATAREEAPYECTACGARLFTDHEECPECGAAAVEAVASEE